MAIISHFSTNCNGYGYFNVDENISVGQTVAFVAIVSVNFAITNNHKAGLSRGVAAAKLSVELVVLALLKNVIALCRQKSFTVQKLLGMAKLA